MYFCFFELIILQIKKIQLINLDLTFTYKCKDNFIECNTLGKAMVINDIEKLEKIASLYAESEEDNIQNMNYFTNNENKKISCKIYK